MFKKITIDGLQVHIYNQDAFKKIQSASNLTKATLEYIKDFIKPGISTNEIDKLCHEYIIKHGGIPAPLNYQGFPKSICTSINHEVCHGIPSERILCNGDIINVDVTVILDGFYGDSSITFAVGDISVKAQRLLQCTKECLDLSIEALKPGVPINTIGSIIEEHANKYKFTVVEEFCGHGIGSEFHQSPNILHFKNNEYTFELLPGMVFTIEPMINGGKKHTKLLSNQWTAVTRDRSLSAQFEHTIGITETGYIIFT